MPPIPVSAEKLSKSGWVTHDTLKLLVGHKPKEFRTPVSRHPRCMIRTTWLFRDGSWSKAEDKVDMRTLGNKTAKLDSPAIMSITIFERPADDPEEVPDSDRDDSAPEARSRSVESLKAEALTSEHMFTHRPKNPYCKICQRAKMLAPHARKRGGSSTIESKAFGDHITIDHVVTRDLRDHGLENEKVAFVVKDVLSKFRYVYPSPTKEADQCHEDLQHFLQVGDKVGVVYSDNAPELKDAVRRMKFRHNTSHAYVDENKAVIEREIRTVLEGTRANLTQAGLPDSLWPYAAQHHAMALNTTKRLDVARIPWEDRFGTPFDGLMIPFGAKVLFWNNPKQNITETSKFAPTGEEGIFLSFHIQPGFIWRKEYLLAPLKGSRDALANGTLKVIRAKRVEVPHGDYTFPLADEEPSRPPRLDDQDCFADGAGPANDDDDDGPPDDDAPGKDEGSDPSGDQPGPPSGEADEDDKAVKGPKPGERPTVDGMTFGGLFGGSDSEEDEGPVPSSGSRDSLQRNRRLNCQTKIMTMLSLRSSGLAPRQWRPQRLLTFMGVNRTSLSNKQTLGKPTHKPCFRALKLGLDSQGTDGLKNGKDSKTLYVLSCWLSMDTRIQEGYGRTIAPLDWRATVGSKFFLKYGRAFSTILN